MVVGKELYPPGFSRSIDTMKTVWLQYMVLDEACMFFFSQVRNLQY